ncbi:MAG: methyl-accepting chemotaxis protein [Planctomycetota bacterium]
MLNWINNLGLGTRIVAAGAFLIVATVTVNYVIFVMSYRGSAREAMIENAAAFTALADETKNYVGRLHERDAFDSDALITELRQALDEGRDYHETRVFSALPVVAGWESAQAAAARENLVFRITSFDARNPDNEPEPGSFREQLLTDLRTQHSATGETILSKVDAETNQLHYMRAIELTADCMMCHGEPGNQYDTDGDGKDILGFQMEGWAPGDMHGAYEVVVPLDRLDDQVAGFVGQGLASTVPIVAGSLFGLWFLVWRVLQRPITAVIDRLREMSEGEGDLRTRLQEKTKDELGRLGAAFNAFIGRIHDTVVEVADSADEVAAAATQITSTSEEMVRGLEEQSSQVSQISSAIEEMSASVNEVAAKSDDASRQAATSGSLAKEGGEVVHSTVEGMHAINDAVSASSESVQQLGKRGDEIGEIVSVINEIADQTNLLALNAAIEAARAGEYGRGFAVVADEVRKLAERTTSATEQIHGSITAIQSDTAQAVDRMSTGAAEVTDGVDRARQAGASLESIVSSAQAVAGSVQQIAAAAAEQSAASEEISRSVLAVSRVTQEASAGAGEAARAASMLTEKATSLRALVARFKVERARG